jgi:DNA-binding NarL/FixJ family response regulator
VRSICASDPFDRESLAATSWHGAVESGNFDSLVTAYRGHPTFLESLRPSASPQLGRLLLRARDSSLARKYGIPIDREMSRGSGTLTSREVEVLELVSTGLSNKEVAQALFIVESTVKVHLRHIYEKLRVRGRTDAVAAWVRQP